MSNGNLLPMIQFVIFVFAVLATCSAVAAAPASTSFSTVSAAAAGTAVEAGIVQIKASKAAVPWPPQCSGRYAAQSKTYISAHHIQHAANTTAPQLDSVLATWKLSTQTTKLFQSLLTNPSIDFRTFTFVARPSDSADVQVEVGAGRRHHNGSIEIAYFSASAHYSKDSRCGIMCWFCGDLTVDVVDLQECRDGSGCPPFCLSNMYAHNGNCYTTGMNMAQLSTLSQMLEYTAYQQFPVQTTINQPNALPLQSPPVAVQVTTSKDDDDDVRRYLSGAMAGIPAMESSLRNGPKSAYMITLYGTYSAFSASAVVARFSVLDDIPSAVAGIQSVFSAYNLNAEFTNYISSELIPSLLARSMYWNLGKLTFQSSVGGYFQSLIIFGRHSNTTGTIELVAGIGSVNYRFADDVLFLRDCTGAFWGLVSSCDYKVVLIPHFLTQEDASQIIAYTDVALIPRLYDLVQPTPRGALLRSAARGAARGAFLFEFLAAIDAMALTWDAVVSAFHTKVEVHLQEIIQTQGYMSLDASTDVLVVEKVPREKTEAFLTLMLQSYSVPPVPSGGVPGNDSDNQAIQRFIMATQLTMQPGELSHSSMMFQAGFGGLISHLSIIFDYDNTTNCSNFYFAQIKCLFSLSPDLFVWRASISVAGGIYTQEQDIVVPVARALTPADIDGIVHILDMISFRNFGENAGLDLPPYPPL